MYGIHENPYPDIDRWALARRGEKDVHMGKMLRNSSMEQGEDMGVPSSKLTWLAGKSPFSIGNTSSNPFGGPFFIAMLVFPMGFFCSFQRHPESCGWQLAIYCLHPLWRYLPGSWMDLPGVHFRAENRKIEAWSLKPPNLSSIWFKQLEG